MKTLTVGFSYAPKKAFSGLIRLVTKSEVSHTYVALNLDNEPVMYQASGLKVNYEHINQFNELEVVVETYETEVEDSRWEELQKFRLKNCGKPYSVREVFGYAWVLLMRKLGKTVVNPFSDGDHAYVCVDIVAAHLGINEEDGSMTPEDLRRWCEKNLKRVK